MDRLPVELQDLPNADVIFKMFKSLPEEYLWKGVNNIKELIKINIDGWLKEITSIIQSNTMIACFCPDISLDLMWGNYAENGTGFAVEYSFASPEFGIVDKETGMQMGTCSLYPVSYGADRFDATEYAKYMVQTKMLLDAINVSNFPFGVDFINKVLPCPDLFMPTKIALNKAASWEKEKEWRLFYQYYSNNNIPQNYREVIMKPSAIYLGRKIGSLNQKILMDMAKEKDIPVYKMYINEKSKKYKLKAKVLTEG